MREIEFRGKVKTPREWSDAPTIVKDNYWNYGDLQLRGSHIYIDGERWRTRVIPETVGQYTEWKDKNGKKIFEGDILGIVNNYSEATKKSMSLAVVKYRKGSVIASWMVDGEENFNHLSSYNTPIVTFEVLGNIHDNPLLLKMGNEIPIEEIPEGGH